MTDFIIQLLNLSIVLCSIDRHTPIRCHVTKAQAILYGSATVLIQVAEYAIISTRQGYLVIKADK